MKRWWFGLLLGIVYVALFQCWAFTGRSFIVVSAVAATFLLSCLFGLAALRGYFWNRWDASIHLAVILDILLEGLLIPSHEGRGFYFCALGFAAVIVAYRRYLGKRGASGAAR